MAKDQMNYIYAAARIRAMENHLFDSEAMERMLECRTAAEMLKVLSDCGYETQGADPEEAGVFDALIAAERSRVFEDVTSMVPDPTLFSFFLYPYDYHNIKTTLKSEIAGRDPERLFIDAGSHPTQGVYEAVRDRTFSGLTRRMEQGAQEALSAYARTHDPQIIDLVLDKYCFGDMLECAERTKSDFAIGFQRLQIDLMNVKALLRLRKAGRSQEFAAQVFCEGGVISADALRDLYEEPFSALAEQWSQSPAAELLAHGEELLGQPGGMSALELRADDLQMAYVRGARDSLFGMEPLIGFLYAKETEFKAVKIIAAGVLAGVAADEIRGRLREAYV